MNIQNPVSDMLIRIKNGYRFKKKSIFCEYSKIKKNILYILKIEGYIKNFIINENKIEIILKYYNNLPVIDKIKLISKPSLKIYYNLNYIKKIKDITGITIISTSKGIMTNKSAKIKKLGGEAICYIN